MAGHETGGPLDRALLARYPVLRRFLAVRGASAVVGSALVVAQSIGIAALLAALASAGPSGVARSTWLPVLAAVVGARVLLAWWDRGHVERTAARWKHQLRDEVTAGLAARPPGRRDADTGAVVTLLTKGIDAVDGYLAGTLAVLPAAVVAPLGAVGAVLVLDWPSGLVLAISLPVVPLLLALVGQYTKSRTEKQLDALLRLGNQFFEAVSGLLTLRVLGRVGRTAHRVREVADAHRKATMSTLRVAFLSAFVLETLTSLAVALVAVPVGFRLLDGAMTLTTGLAVLLLTPEVYRPVRLLGASFHAGQEAIAVLGELDAVLATPARPGSVAPPGEWVPAPDPRLVPVELRGLAVGFGRAVLTDVSLTLRPGTGYAVTGVSGAGKSTLLRTIAGLLAPVDGRILVGDVDLAAIEPAAWTARIGVVPQRPHLFTGTVADNVRIGRSDATDDDVTEAVAQAGAAEFVRGLPDGLDTFVGERGLRLSSGERQRIALARALLRRPSLLLLDEPTAHLDGGTEQVVLDALDLVGEHRTVVVVTHRRQVADRADEVIEVADGTARLLAVAR